MVDLVAIIAAPKNGEDALGRVFNGLALAAEARAKLDEVNVFFIGAGTRWPAEMSKLGHPAQARHESVRESIVAASCRCAAVFGAADGARACGIREVKDNAIPGTPGLASVRRYLAEGWQTILF